MDIFKHGPHPETACQYLLPLCQADTVTGPLGLRAHMNGMDTTKWAEGFRLEVSVLPIISTAYYCRWRLVDAE